MMLLMRGSGAEQRWARRSGTLSRLGGLVTIAAALSSIAGCGQQASNGGPLPTLSIIGETGKLPGQFGHPRCIDNDGSTLWVVDRLARVQQFDIESGKPLQEWRTPKYDRGKPTGITIWKGKDAPTLLCIADTHEARVLIYAIADAQGNRTPADADGRPPLLATFGAFGEDLGLFIYPTDIAIVSNEAGTGIERMFVGEYGGNDRISVWELAPGSTADGSWIPQLSSEGLQTGAMPTFQAVRSFGSFGTGPNEFNRPQSLSVWAGADGKLRTSDDELIVVDTCNHRIGRFLLSGELVRWYGSAQGSSDAPGALSYPYGLQLLPDDTALVSEFGNNRVQRLDLNTGDCLGLFGEGGRMRGQLVTPWGISVMGDKAYVLDTGNARVQSFAVPKGKKVIQAATLQTSSNKTGGAR